VVGRFLCFEFKVMSGKVHEMAGGIRYKVT
jgi:hypothetical protein